MDEELPDNIMPFEKRQSEKEMNPVDDDSPTKQKNPLTHQDKQIIETFDVEQPRPEQEATDDDERDLQVSREIETRLKEAVGRVGNKNRYQIQISVFFSMVFFQATVLILASSYLFMNPNFICDGSETHEEAACQNVDLCYLKNDFTLTAKSKLYCSRQDERDAIQTMYGIGALIGVLTVNLLGDYKGRRFALLVALSVGVLSFTCVIIGAYSSSGFFYIISQIMAGYSALGCLTTTYTYIDKIMAQEWRVKGVYIFNCVGALGEVMMIIFTKGLNWWHYSFICGFGLCLTLLIVGWFLLIEDPVLLFTKKRYDECRQSLTRLAKVNKKEDYLPETLEIVNNLKNKHMELESQTNPEQTSSWKKKLQYLKVFKNWDLVLKPLLLFGAYAFAANLGYYVQNYMGSEVGLSYGVDMSLFGVAEMLGTVPLMIYSNVKRRLGAMILLTASGILSLLFLINLTKVEQTIIEVIVRMIGVTNYCLYANFVVESFPQHIQSTSFGLIEVMAKFGTILSPIVVRVADSVGISPVLIIAVTFIGVGTVAVFFLKETITEQKGDSQQKSNRMQLAQQVV